MRNIWLVARREYLEQVRGRAFKMTTFGVPAIFAAVFGIGYLSKLGPGLWQAPGGCLQRSPARS